MDRKREHSAGIVLVGGVHNVISQQAIGNSFNSVGLVLGGGADFSLAPAISWRAQADYVGSHIFGSWQNNFEVKTGIVLKF